MRYLGVDLGTKRTGLAISDPTGLIARPLEVVRGGVDAADLAEVLRPIVAREEIEALVVGLPKRLGGEEGPEAAHARTVAVALETSLGLVATLWDERLSTVEATDRLIEAGVRRKKRKAVVDKVAAALILQSFLDSKRGAPDDPRDLCQ
jgi:putative Holliday junction resolvase